MKGAIRVMRDVVLHAWVGTAGRLAVQLPAVLYKHASRLYVSEGPFLVSRLHARVTHRDESMGVIHRKG
jgi:hypothetical protein